MASSVIHSRPSSKHVMKSSRNHSESFLQCERSNYFLKAEIVTDFFKKLTILMTDFLPKRLIQSLELLAIEDRALRTKEILGKTIAMANCRSLTQFLNCLMDILQHEQGEHDDLIAFLSDSTFSDILKQDATHLDIRDMVTNVRKAMLPHLYAFTQQCHSGLDSSYCSLKDQLTSYEWVSKLSHYQSEIVRLTGKSEPLAIRASLMEIGIALSDDSNVSVDTIKRLVHHYGIIKSPKRLSGTQQHKVLTVEAVNLSLLDFMSNDEFKAKIEQCDEARFLCSDCFYLDNSIDSYARSNWTPLSIAIVARKVVVKGNQCINLSGWNGKDGAVMAAAVGKGNLVEYYNPTSKLRMPQIDKADNENVPREGECGGNGKPGKDGVPGMSGGNILICTDEIVNSGQLTLNSCGGKGGRGQDGGDGQHGKCEHGHEIDFNKHPETWPSDFARSNTVFGGDQSHYKIREQMKSYPSCQTECGAHQHTVFMSSETPEGVKLLFATNEIFWVQMHGFLFSKSKDGISASGGNAGIGGKGGGGGQAGTVEIIRFDRSHYYDIEQRADCSSKEDSLPGDTGGYGRKSIAYRKNDHLIVDGIWWGTSESYDGFINVVPWKDRPPDKNELGNGSYNCSNTVSKHFDMSIDSDDLVFFKTDRDLECPTKSNHTAVHGEAIKQDEIIKSTPTTQIDKSAIQIAYQTFTSKALDLTDHTALLQSFYELENTLQHELVAQDTVHQIQHYKQLRYKSYQQEQDSIQVIDVSKPVSEGVRILVFNQDEMHSLAPWVTGEDVAFFISAEKGIQDKYTRIAEIISTLKTHAGPSWSSSHHLSKDDSALMCNLLHTVFVPIVCIAENPSVIVSASQILSEIQQKIHPKVHEEFMEIYTNLTDMLVKQFHLMLKVQVYETYNTDVSLSDQNYQSKMVFLHLTECLKIFKLKKVPKLAEFRPQTRKRDIKPCQTVPRYHILPDPYSPFHEATVSALNALTHLANAANEVASQFHAFVPDIWSTVQTEYEAFQRSISETDLLYIINYLQRKLEFLSNSSLLEDLFCDNLLLQLDSSAVRKDHFILYNGKTYRIKGIHRVSEYQLRLTVQITGSHQQETFEITSSSDISFNNVAASECPEYVWAKCASYKVLFNGDPITVPNEALLLSPVDIGALRDQLQQTALNPNLDPNFEIPELKKCHNELTSIVQQIRSAQEIPYDIFTFTRPLEWVERLLLRNLQTQYLDVDVSVFQRTLSGLSNCIDKSLHLAFLDEFLEDECLHESSDILDVLTLLKSVFIDRQLCTVVTEQGIKENFSGIDTFTELQDIELIDHKGAFLPSATSSAITVFCQAHDESPEYLLSVFKLHQFCVSLEDRELIFWRHKLSSLQLNLGILDVLAETPNESDWDQMVLHSQMMVRHYDSASVNELINTLTLRLNHIQISSMKLLLQKCATKEWIFDIALKKLQENKTIVELEHYNWESEFTTARTCQFIVNSLKDQFPSGHSAKLEHVTGIVNKIKMIKEKRTCSNLMGMETPPIYEYTKEHIQAWAEKFKSPEVLSQVMFGHHLFIEAFAVICRAITVFYFQQQKKSGSSPKEITPRDTQLMASLLFLQRISYKDESPTKLMQQISTGEGKTMIICMTTIFRVLLGQTVDIVTSSSVLATRDAEEQRGLYELFGINVGHCCHDDIRKRRNTYKNEVIYGDVGSFQRDILETDFYDKKIRASRKCANVFIDEVDSMLVDKGETMLYLPHAVPDLNTLESIYLEIWMLVNDPSFLGTPEQQDQLHESLKHRIFGGVHPTAFTAIPDVDEQQSASIHQKCVKCGLLEPEYHYPVDVKASKDILQKLTPLNLAPQTLQCEVMMIIQQHLESSPTIQTVPACLHHFVKKSLRPWVASAVIAKYSTPNKEYIIDIDRRESAADRYPKIIIMDNETGVEQESSEWGDGLHQFLQLKHNLRLSTESLKAVYMSNISFFRSYSNVMGVTGTLGSNAEQDLFKTLYKEISQLVLPTNMPSRLRVEDPHQFPKEAEEDWKNAIDCVEDTFAQGRAVLFICEDVERALHLNDFFKSKSLQLEPIVYTSSHQPMLENEEVQQGQLIIATNLAGRGTDIKLSPEVRKNGGLHVCLAYLPPNVRVEQQAYGRAARSGDPGSCQMIFRNQACDQDMELSYVIKRRDLREAARVDDIEADYFHNIKFQEELFKKFSHLYDKVKKTHEKKPELGRPALDHCLDCWAFFLDKHTDEIESFPKMKGQKVQKKRIRKEFFFSVKERMKQLSPPRLMQQGNIHMKRAVKKGKKFKSAGNKVKSKNALETYDDLLKIDPQNPFARYYRAAAHFNHEFEHTNTAFSGVEEAINKVGEVVTQKHDPLIESKDKELRRELKQTFYELIPLFHAKIDHCQAQITALQLANKKYDHSALTGNMNYFSEQKNHEIEVYQQYIDSMQTILGCEITSKNFEHADWGAEGAEIVFVTIKRQTPLKGPRISGHHHKKRLEDMLKTKSSQYHTFESAVANCLKSKELVAKETFTQKISALPSKQHFWKQIKAKNVITHTVPRHSTAKYSTGYWNPTIDVTNVQFDHWDSIDSGSFEWISGFSDPDRKELVAHLKQTEVLNFKCQLNHLDLAKSLSIPQKCIQHYKEIKDTLWHHSVYRYAVDHLKDCVIIKPDEIQNSPSDANPSCSSGDYESVEDLIISMNAKLNSSTKHLGSGETQKDHVHADNYNQLFREQLHKHGLCETKVSGDDNNCLIHAIVQHAKQEYTTDYFEEAKDIRKCVLKEHPQAPGTLHFDDHIAESVLKAVNEQYMAEFEARIGVISVVKASNDGPVSCGQILDKRYPSGRRVVIWEQGNHYVSIVHKDDMEPTVSTLTADQKHVLLNELHIIEPSENDEYKICLNVDSIHNVLQSTTSLSPRSKKQVWRFLCEKLEIDYLTLKRFEVQLTDSRLNDLYEDLYVHSVIKPTKAKDIERAEKVCNSEFGYESHLRDGKPTLRFSSLNAFFRVKNIQPLTADEQTEAVTFLQNHSIIPTGLVGSVVDATADLVLNQGIVDTLVGVAEPVVDSLHSTTEAENKGECGYCVDPSKLSAGLSEVLSKMNATEAQKSGLNDYFKMLLKFKENVKFIISTLSSQRSTLVDLETPQITLRRLSDLFDDSIQDKGDVIGWFSDNQCDLIISIDEMKWSWKTITVAVFAITLGVVQIVAGAVGLALTAGTGAFFFNALISEGVSDMIFGIEGLVNGHCNWSQFFKNKAISMAINIATAGVGAYLAWGKQASVYAYKAFGTASKVVMKETAERTGQSVTRIMAKEVMKKISKEVAGAVVDAGIGLATDAIVQQLTEAIENMCKGIIESFEQNCVDEDLREKMLTFVQLQDKGKAKEFLHQVTMSVLQSKTASTLWSILEDNAKKLTDVALQGHGQTTSHLEMRGEQLGGQSIMKGIGYVSRFAPLVSEFLKGGLVLAEMKKVKECLKDKLDDHIKAKAEKQYSPQGQETEEHKSVVDGEVKEMKLYFTQQMSEHGQSIAKQGLQMVAQEVKKQAVELGKKHIVAPAREKFDRYQLERNEQKLKEAKLKSDTSEMDYRKHKLEKLMTRSRSPEVFARLIEDHDALLGPAFAIPALEKLPEINRPIKIVDEHGKEFMNVPSQAKGKAIEITFILGNPGHYMFEGQKYTVESHGNNCLIIAVLAGAGLSNTTEDHTQMRKKIAAACLDPTHPCHDYIKKGIARNYIRIGLVGGAVEYKNGNLQGRPAWCGHIDDYLRKDLGAQAQHGMSAKLIDRVKKSEVSFGEANLDRCHRLSDHSIKQLVMKAFQDGNKSIIEDMRKTLLPTLEEVGNRKSILEGSPSKKAFEEHYGATGQGKTGYEQQVNSVKGIIENWDDHMSSNAAKKAAMKTLATEFFNAPANVSLGHAPTNRAVGKFMDFNPGSPRSSRILDAFKDYVIQRDWKNGGEVVRDGIIEGPRQLSNEAYVTSFFNGTRTHFGFVSLKDDDGVEHEAYVK